MTPIPSPREHGPIDRGAEPVKPQNEPNQAKPLAYPWTTVYVMGMATLILLAVLFDWRL